MNDLGAITTPDDYPHGLRCMSCDEIIEYSEAHVYRPINDDVNEVWCAACALTDLTEGRGE